MTVKALVIDDDPAILSTVAEILESLGHQCDRTDSMEAARQRLGCCKYSYILLDLEIPVRFGGLARIQNGENLLTEIVGQAEEGRKVPVIIMTAHGTDGFDMAVRMMKKGAVDYCPKPFKTQGQTLDKCILEALGPETAVSSRPGDSKTPIAERADEKAVVLTPFNGGVLKFFSDRVELCDVDIASGPRSERAVKAFRLFRQRRQDGTFVTYGCEEIARELGLEGGQSGGAGWILRIRKRIRERLKARANIECGDEDVIQTTASGYQLRDWLSVQDDTGADETEILGHTSCEQGDDDLVDDRVSPTASDRVNRGDLVIDPPKRRAEILHRLDSGEQLRAPKLAEALRCSDATIKRDIEVLKKEGHNIVFVGAFRTGCYQLKKR